MGSKELIESLFAECDERIKELERKAKALASEIQADAAIRIEHTRHECELLESSGIKEEKKHIIERAGKKIRTERLLSEQDLAERLFALAGLLLPVIMEDSNDHFFSALADELPDIEWKVVRINPADEVYARKRFPDAEIIIDEEISGGLEVISDNGGIRIDNTFEKRLERIWPDIIPRMIGDVYKEVGSEGTAPGP